MTGKRSNGDVAQKNVEVAPMGAVYWSLAAPVVSALYIGGFLNVLYRALVEAYTIRLYAINEFGLVIHEFDPYFNYRAAEVRRDCLVAVEGFSIDERKLRRVVTFSEYLTRFGFVPLSVMDGHGCFTVRFIYLYYVYMYMYMYMYMHMYMHISVFAIVFVGKWFIDVFQVVRLPVMVSFGSTRRNNHLSRDAIHECLDQNVHTPRLVDQ